MPGVQTVLDFQNALNARDLPAMLALLSEDTVFENTFPAPDGERYAGRDAVAGFWQEFFDQSRESYFDIEEVFGCVNRFVLRWTYNWVDLDGQTGHVRGVDIFTVRDGLISEKCSYVKG